MVLLEVIFAIEVPCNRISLPSNRSKQTQGTHIAYRAGTQYMQQSLNEKQQTWLIGYGYDGFIDNNVVFHIKFATYIVYFLYKPC